MPRIIRLADLPVVAWKNGGGSTREYAVHPVGAGFGDFGWRVSRAEIRAVGPFSKFEGVDRTLMMIDGAGLELIFPEATISLVVGAAPLSFAGETPVEARPLGGASTDLNAMTRRDNWRHEARRLDLKPGEILTATGQAWILIARAPCRVRVEGRYETLADGDALLGTEVRAIVAFYDLSPSQDKTRDFQHV